MCEGEIYSFIQLYPVLITPSLFLHLLKSLPSPSLLSHLPDIPSPFSSFFFSLNLFLSSFPYPSPNHLFHHPSSPFSWRLPSINPLSPRLSLTPVTPPLYHPSPSLSPLPLFIRSPLFSSLSLSFTSTFHHAQSSDSQKLVFTFLLLIIVLTGWWVASGYPI